MKNIGLCTHFSQTDEWAFNFALDLVRRTRMAVDDLSLVEFPVQPSPGYGLSIAYRRMENRSPSPPNC